jgi:hypothetical protein
MVLGIVPAMSLLLATLADASEPTRAHYVWACPLGPAEVVRWLYDHVNRTLDVDAFASLVDLSTLPPPPKRGHDIQIISVTDWEKHFSYVPGFTQEDISEFPRYDSIQYRETVLPSGSTAWFLVHSGIEYLFVLPGVDLEQEFQAIREQTP